MIAHKHLPKDIARIIYWYPVRWIVQVLPSSALYVLGNLFGKIDSLLSGRKRMSLLQANIQHGLKTDSARSREIALSTLQNHQRNMLEFMKYPLLSLSNLHKVCNLHGLGNVDEALKLRKGVILITAHFGAKQLLQSALGLKGYNVNQINYHMHKEELSKIQHWISQNNRKRIEARIPVRFIQAKGVMKQAYKCLKQNQLLILAGDGSGLVQHMDRTYQVFPFLHSTMRFPTNWVNLSLRTQAAVIPVFTVRKEGKHDIFFHPALKKDQGSVSYMVQNYIQILEKYVYTYPEQWEFWEEFQSGILRSM